MVSKLTFILGGVRSGKSTHALKLAYTRQCPVTFIATATAQDDEMRERIHKHQEERPSDWQTIEAPLHVGHIIQMKGIKSPVVILDCITMLVSNILLAFKNPETLDMDQYQNAINNEIGSLIETIHQTNAHWIIISNEVGLGVVPAYKLGRLYRDGLGRTNQTLAATADEVFFMAAGLPLQMK
ncbi:MAG: bifunctional adenosylcobinamide kinase/adenosylcobinamide-phosphate guanylyltransferase [Anaerolineaceae bacterium]|nr:bifunctional adenosylcobinamide kinase/adenosylcobinamide-phosphate guanylyltransferase [Anaerolineaceae bacterium]